MLIEQQQRAQRVRFKHPIRVVTLDGPPRVIRTLTTNVSRRGLFVRMPEPLPEGCRVALSLEAAGRALAFAQAEVAWGRAEESKLPGRFPGCGVRFTEFLHPRAKDLVEYLVENLDTGKPLILPSQSRARRWWLVGGAAAGALGLTAIGVGSFLLLSPGTATPVEEELAPLAVLPSSVVVGTPVVAPVADVAIPGAVAPATMTGAAVEASTSQAGDDRSEIVVAALPVAPGHADRMADVVAAPEASAQAVGQNAAKAVPERTAQAAPESAEKPVPALAVAPAPETGAVAAPEVPAKAAEELAGARGAVVVAPAGPPVLTSKGTVRLPSGGAAKLAWSSDGRIVRLTPTLAPGAKLSKVFVLAGPSRAVFDFEGVAPKKSHQLEADAPHVAGVRVGKLGRGTRVVVDLEDVPVSYALGDGVTLTF